MTEEFSNVPPQALQSREEFAKFFSDLDAEISSLETLTAAATPATTSATNGASPANEKTTTAAVATSTSNASATAADSQKVSEEVSAQSEKLYGVFKHKAHIGIENGVLVFKNLPPEFEKKASSILNRVETLQRRGSLTLTPTITTGVFSKKTSVTSEVLAEMKAKDSASTKSSSSSSTSPASNSPPSTSPGSTSPPVPKQPTGWLNPTKADEEKMRIQRLVNINKAMMDFEYEETLASMDSNIRQL